MDKEVFEYSDYRAYLDAWITSQPSRGRGARSAIAKAIECPNSHVSQVLKGTSNLSMEQAEELNGFLGHSTEESEYFLLLLQRSRAGTRRLQSRIEAQLQAYRDRRLNLKDRLQTKRTIGNEEQARFYSSWHYVAVHVLLSIERCQTRDAVSKSLGLSMKRTLETLEFLESLGLVARQGDRYVIGESNIHLGSDSPMIAKHHTNWRLQAIRSLDHEEAKVDLHYSSTITLSKSDVARIKSMLIEMIEKARAVVAASEAEEMHSLCFDFFRVQAV